MKKIVCLIMIFMVYPSNAQYLIFPPGEEYRQLQNRLARGWNTWNTQSMLSHVLMPEAFAVNICLKSSRHYLNTVLMAFWRSEKIRPGLHADDGSYTSLEMEWEGNVLRVESAHDGEDEVILVTPLKREGAVLHLVIETGFLWNRQGCIERQGQVIIATPATHRSIKVSVTAPVLEDNTIVCNAPYLCVDLLAGQPMGVFTGQPRTLEEIQAIVSRQKNTEEIKAARYGNLSEAYRAMQTVLAWNVIYEPEKDRVISPVSRTWNYNWGGYVLFDWDTYFAAYMYSLYNKELAYANAIEITREITPQGFIPNYAAPYGIKSYDRSQPPVGSFVVREIYRRYREKWFLNEVYDALLTWNRWWIKNRMNKGYLCWGSHVTESAVADHTMHSMKGAMLESGLDNSPMYDDVPFNDALNVMELADVGLMSFYVMDCEALADIATVLGKKDDAAELRQRAKEFREKIQSLWSEQDGIFLNKRTDNNTFNHRLSPTNFYPLLAKVPHPKQAMRMIREHYFNPDEFYGTYVMPSIARNDRAFADNDYWRGRIWAPMNFLVYLGMLNYNNLEEARIDLVNRSLALLMKSWKDGKRVYENYNAVTGEGDDVKSADWFYHWGALLGFMSFIETGYMDKPR